MHESGRDELCGVDEAAAMFAERVMAERLVYPPLEESDRMAAAIARNLGHPPVVHWDIVSQSVREVCQRLSSGAVVFVHGFDGFFRHTAKLAQAFVQTEARGAVMVAFCPASRWPKRSHRKARAKEGSTENVVKEEIV